MTERFFAPCPRGLEAALAAELTRIAATDVAVADGGVGFTGGLDLACRANLESRIASRVLWRVGGGPYRDEHALYDLVKAVDWKALFAPARTLRVDIAAKRSPLQSLEFATLRVKDAICDRLRDDTELISEPVQHPEHEKVAAEKCVAAQARPRLAEHG